MEERKLRVIFSKDGHGSTNSKVTLPITHLRKMKVDQENREINYYYDEENDIMILSKNKIKDINISKIIKE